MRKLKKRKAPEPPPGPPYHGRTPQSVLDAPKLQPETIWPLVEPRPFEPLRMFFRRVGSYQSPKVRKVRRGRKARFNHA